MSYKEELKHLNEEQVECVLKSILCGGSPTLGSSTGSKVISGKYHMVLGTPGSGKTTAIVALVKIIAKLKQRVLLVNFTNQAIDNVLIRLKESGFNDFIRVTNNISSVDPLLHDNVKTYHMFDTMQQIQDAFEETYIFGTTCLQMNNNLLLCVNRGKFDYCIMDEASQISEPLALGPILVSDKFIMIGDFY